MHAEPYFELPIPIGKVRPLKAAQFRLGSHRLPIKQGRMSKLAVPRYLRKAPCVLSLLLAMSSITCLSAFNSMLFGRNLLVFSRCSLSNETSAVAQ